MSHNGQDQPEILFAQFD